MKKKILIIDDDPDFLAWIECGLLPDGYAVLTAQTAVDGLRRARQEHPDRVILDIKLPDRDGFCVCQDLKADPRCGHMRVMLITGVYREVEYKERGYLIGCDDFLVKPFSYEQLRARVHRLLGRAAGSGDDLKP